MKRTLIPILLLIICSVNLVAQDTIVLDGKKIPKEKLNPYSGLGYEIDLTKPENKPSLASPSAGKEMKITSQRVFASKGMKSFLQATIERSDTVAYYLSSSSMKFFDEKGKVKWEKKFEKKAPMFCYLTPDGKYSIADIHNLSFDPFEETNSLSIFDENGNTILEYQGPVKYQISDSRDLVCYKKDIISTQNIEDNYLFYCFDLKNKMHWSKNFEKEVDVRPVSTNGDYIIAYSDSVYTLFSRDGKQVFKKKVVDFGGGIRQVTYDGEYALGIRSSSKDTSRFVLFNLKTMKKFTANYYRAIEDTSLNGFFTGGCFVNNSHYLVAVTTVIDPKTAIIILFNIYGKYIGHKVYFNIQSMFGSPNISLQNDGSFEVNMDGIYLGNLTLPGVNTKQYLSKTAE